MSSPPSPTVFRPRVEPSSARSPKAPESQVPSSFTSILGSDPARLFDPAANETLAEFVREKIRAIVDDRETAGLLCPNDHPVGSKRMCIDTGYFETFNRDNVTLVNLKAEPIERVTPNGVATTKRDFEFDSIVLATGFDAITGTLAKIAVTGRGGRTLKDEWAEGPGAYLGLMVEGFPNLFLITGPSSPSVLSNMMVSIEQHVGFIGQIVERMTERGSATIEPTAEAQHAWLEHTAAVAAPTVYPSNKSWYTGANIPGKPRVFMAYIGGVPGYRHICDAIARDGYPGFAFDGEASAPPADFAALMAPPQPAAVA